MLRPVYIVSVSRSNGSCKTCPFACLDVAEMGVKLYTNSPGSTARLYFWEPVEGVVLVSTWSYDPSGNPTQTFKTGFEYRQSYMTLDRDGIHMVLDEIVSYGYDEIVCSSFAESLSGKS